MSIIRKAKLALTILCLSFLNCGSTGAQGARAALAANHYHSRQLSVVRAAFENASFEGSPDGNNAVEKLSAGAVTGVVVASVIGGAVLVVILGVLIRWLSQRSRTSSGTDLEKSGSNPETKAPAPTSSFSSAWNCCCRKHRSPAAKRAQRVRPPVFGTDRQDPDEISDTSFVLPELGGPNPHNKFDGMEWVDIKGMDDEALVEISSDLRKYSTTRGDY